MQARNYTTRSLADLLGSETWKVRRLFEDGTLPEAERFAGKRVIPSTQVPAVIEAMRKRGWLSSAETVPQ